MEPLFLCWMFDRRWLCNIANPCFQFLLTIPVVVNIVIIVCFIAERSKVHVEVESSFVLLVVLYSLLAILNFYLMLKTHLTCSKKLQTANQNYEAIKEFTHLFEAKKNIWSWTGLAITILSIGQIFVNRLYINYNQSTYPCNTNVIRFYLDICGWGYIGFIIVLFLLFKLIFLFLAWKNPEKYLKFKEVI